MKGNQSSFQENINSFWGILIRGNSCPVYHRERWAIKILIILSMWIYIILGNYMYFDCFLIIVKNKNKEGGGRGTKFQGSTVVGREFMVILILLLH